MREGSQIAPLKENLMGKNLVEQKHRGDPKLRNKSGLD